MTFTHALSTNNYGPAKFIVSANAYEGTHTTIAAALTAASSGDTIFIRPGTYTENPTLKAGVNLCAYDCDPLTPNVIINGTCSFTAAGTVTISGICLRTNSAALISVTGSAASILNIEQCFLDITNNDGITYSSSSASSAINIRHSNGDLGTTGIKIFSHSSAGRLLLFDTRFVNTGASTTASTASAGVLDMQYTYLRSPITTSGTCQIFAQYVYWVLNAINTTCLTVGGSVNPNTIVQCNFNAGSATDLTITTAASVSACNFNSTNTAAISGAGTIAYSGLCFLNTGNTITTTTATPNYEGSSRKIGSTNSGATNTLTVLNDSNTASSSANIVASVAGGTAADATHQAVVSGVTTWTWGVDNSDSDAFVVAASAALGTTNVIHGTTAGILNYPLQPLVIAYKSSDDANATGDGTSVTVVFDTEVADVQSNYNNSTGAFTAPVTGKYLICGSVGLTAIGTQNTSNCQIILTSRTLRGQSISPTAAKTSGNQLGYWYNGIGDMTAGDTVSIQITANGSTKTVTLQGNTLTTTFLNIFLLC